MEAGGALLAVVLFKPEFIVRDRSWFPPTSWTALERETE